jgi:hypothetical protein
MMAAGRIGDRADYRIAFRADGPLLRARVTGTGSLPSTIAYWLQIAAEVRARKPAALLLIDELQGPALSPDQWQSLVEGMKQQGLETVRIAHVKPLGLQTVEHCEIYAREIGLDARVFDNETNARLWLRYGAE